MKIAMALGLSALIGMGSLLQGNASKDPQNKVYLSDSSGNILDSSLYDEFGNLSFDIQKPGLFQIQMRAGNRILWSKRALLNSGRMAVSVPLNAIHSGLRTYEEDRDGTMDKISRTVSGIATMEMADDLAPVATDMEMPVMAREMSVSEAKIRKPTSKKGIAKSDAVLLKKRGPELDKDMDPVKPKAGTLTAGIWNDLEHWEKFKKTLEAESTEAQVWNWQLHKRRYAIEISNSKGKPAIDVKVQIRDESGNTLWNALTDNRGFAELWYAPFEVKEIKKSNYYLYAQYGEKPWTKLGKVSENGDLRNSFRLDYLQETPKPVDIAFIVDATGSMGDEITYLKEELMELMLRTKEFAPCSDIRLASVFYRDRGDAYLAKHAPFTDRYEDAVSFIQDQSAGGGGDFPEAVDAGMEEALQKLTWSPKALARICFLVLDAPPHIENKAQIEALTQQYAEKGIKIIPIAASGINKSTEFLLKQIAAISNGEYLYITDDSGVGNSHLKPSGVESDVDLLINQMEKVIRKYTQTEACDQEPKPYDPEPRTLIFGDDQIIIQSYPNPAFSFINVHSNIKIQKIQLLNINGSVVKNIENIAADRYRLDIRDLSKAMYILRVQTAQKSYSTKVLILDSQRLD